MNISYRGSGAEVALSLKINGDMDGVEHQVMCKVAMETNQEVWVCLHAVVRHSVTMSHVLPSGFVMARAYLYPEGPWT